MAATPVPARRRRRPRRGSLDRPVSFRLYRASFLVLAIPLLVLAFGIARPGSLPAPPLPPNFDGADAVTLADNLATRAPDRPPGSSGAVKAATWFRTEMSQYDLPVHADTWDESVPGLGRVRLQNLWAVAAGQSAQAILVIAHRDNSGIGPGVNNNASGTAALVELARSYARASSGVPSTHTIVFLSTDGGSFGGIGAARFAARTHLDIVAAVNLAAIGGRAEPGIEIAGDTPRSPTAELVETAARRVTEQTGVPPGHIGVFGQLIDLGFPYTLYDQGPFVARGIPTVTLTTAGSRPPELLTDQVGTLSVERMSQLGRAAQQLIGSLDQGLVLAPGTTTYLLLGERVVRGVAVELLLVALLVPFLVAVVDLFARCRRRRLELLPAIRSLRTRLLFWLFVALAFYAFRFLGAWPSGAGRPLNPASHVAGDWPVLSLIGFGLVLLLGWAVARQRLVPRRPISPDERLAGDAAALLGLALASLLVLATNPFALLFFLPPLHAWLWLPNARSHRWPLRVGVLVAGLAGPALVLLSLGLRFGLGFDAPWYLLTLVSVGWIHVPPVAIALGSTACAAQLVAVSANRYAPYPRAGERPVRGPIRELIRSVVLTVRARRRVSEERRRAFGG